MSALDALRSAPGSISNATPYQLRALVLEYLCHQCYTKTARAFAKDSAVRHLDADGDEILANTGSSPAELTEEGLKQVELRQKIRLHILAGRVDDATVLLNRHFPSVLSGRKLQTTPPMPPETRISNIIEYVAPTSVDPAHLTLNLRILSFIEACRTIPLVPPQSIPHAERQLTPVPENPPDDEASSPLALMEQKIKLITKGQKLHELAKLLPKLEDRTLYIQELNNVGGLLAYETPETSPISKYMSQERREAVADQINCGILDKSNMPPVSSLELLTRYTSTVWSFAHQAGAKPRPGVLLPPSNLEGLHTDPEIVPSFELRQFLDLKI